MIKNERTVREVRLIGKFVNGGEESRCIIGDENLSYLDQFLLFEDSKMLPPAGYPDHPHRGFEVLFYMLSGKIRHENFFGHDSKLGQGDILFISTGKGVVHSELPVETETEVPHELQLWINMPSGAKTGDPAYYEIPHYSVPSATQDGVKATVLLGAAFGVEATAKSKTSVLCVDFVMAPKSKHIQDLSENWTGFVYVLEGCATISGTKIPQYNCAFLSEGSLVVLENNSMCDTRLIFVAGAPLNEPMERNNQFVMNTKEQIEESIVDFEEFKNGFERAKAWKGSSKRL